MKKEKKNIDYYAKALKNLDKEFPTFPMPPNIKKISIIEKIKLKILDIDFDDVLPVIQMYVLTLVITSPIAILVQVIDKLPHYWYTNFFFLLFLVPIGGWGILALMFLLLLPLLD